MEVSRGEQQDILGSLALHNPPGLAVPSRPDVSATEAKPGRPRGLQGRKMPGAGFEPATFGLQNRCTTTVLTRPKYIIP